MKWYHFYLDSVKEFKKTRTLALLGMFAAIAIVLGYVASIDIGPYIKIGFSSIPNRLVDFMFGPVVGAIFGGVLDVVKFIVKPSGTFFFGFTFDAMLAGFLFGSIMYKKKVTIPRLLVAEFLIKTIVNCGFNTLWVSMLYGKGFLVLLPARLLKNAIMWPIDTMILFFFLTAMGAVLKRWHIGSGDSGRE